MLSANWGLEHVKLINFRIQFQASPSQVQHPAAKSMIEISRTQDEEVGDGTTSVIILAGELLKNAEPFLVENMHPTLIIAAYRQVWDYETFLLALGTFNFLHFWDC